MSFIACACAWEFVVAQASIETSTSTFIVGVFGEMAKNFNKLQRIKIQKIKYITPNGIYGIYVT